MSYIYIYDISRLGVKFVTPAGMFHIKKGSFYINIAGLGT